MLANVQKFKYNSFLEKENVVKDSGLLARVTIVPSSSKHQHPVSPPILFFSD